MRNAVFAVCLEAALLAAPVGGVAGELIVDVLNHGGHATLLDGVVTFRRGTRRIEASLDSTGHATIAVPVGTWEITCEGRNLYCPPVVRTLRTDRLVLDGFGLTEITAELAVPASSTIPGSLAVQGIFSLADSPNGKQTFEHRTLVKVQGVRISFRVPATRLDLRVAAEGFAPSYRWGVDVKSGRHDLGKLTLRPGSSLFGVALEVVGEAPAANVEVRLEPLAQTVEGDARRLLQTRARTSSRGFFQITDIAPSRYRLVLLRDGKRVGGMSPIEVPPGSEVRLDAVRLTPPLVARLKISPVLTPNEKPWQVILRQLSPDLFGVPLDLSAKTSPEGEVVFSDLPPGPYQLYVQDERASRLFFERTEILANVERTIVLPLSAVEGRVLLGSNPLKARVLLGSGGSDEASFESDEQGLFNGTIRTPTRGVLFATVQSATPLFSRRVVVKDPRVDVDRGTVEVEIKLEDKVIEGRVTTSTGVGVPGLSVVAVAEQFNSIETTSRTDGSFELRPADSTVYAVSLRRKGAGVGKTVIADLTQLERTTVAMSIGRYRRGHLRVLSSDGVGVPGATLFAKPVGFAGFTLRTDLQGLVDLPWPVGVSRVFLTASSLSAPASSGCFNVSDPGIADPEGEVDLEIRLPAQPGSRVRLAFERFTGEASAPANTEHELLIVSRGGGLWRQFEVTSLNDEGGLPAGEYAAVWNRGPLVNFLDRWCTSGPPGGLRWTPVGAGQEATLQVPLPPRSTPTRR